MQTVYLAAPLFTLGERAFNFNLAMNLENINNNQYRMFLPQDILPKDTASLLYSNLMSELTRANLVLAVLDGPDADSGVCYEIGYARALGKKIIMIRTDFREGGDNNGSNLMLTQGKDLIHPFRADKWKLTDLVVKLNATIMGALMGEVNG